MSALTTNIGHCNWSYKSATRQIFWMALKFNIFKIRSKTSQNFSVRDQQVTRLVAICINRSRYTICCRSPLIRNLPSINSPVFRSNQIQSAVNILWGSLNSVHFILQNHWNSQSNTHNTNPPKILDGIKESNGEMALCENKQIKFDFDCNFSSYVIHFISLLVTWFLMYTSVRITSKSRLTPKIYQRVSVSVRSSSIHVVL